MSFRLVPATTRALLASGLLIAAAGCSSGVSAFDDAAQPPPAPAAGVADSNVASSVVGNPTQRSGAHGGPREQSYSEFEARWSYLSVHSAPEHTNEQWNGTIDGPVTLWYPGGGKRGEGRYEHSSRVGPWVFWYDNGQLRWQGTYDEGEISGRELAWYENGQLELECNWSDGVRDGVYVLWHENGRLAAQGEYRRGKREGRFHYFRADGTADEIQTGQYIDDVRTSD